MTYFVIEAAPGSYFHILASQIGSTQVDVEDLQAGRMDTNLCFNLYTAAHAALNALLQTEPQGNC